MKKFTKWLALLMAGLLLSASLIACESAYTSSDEDEDEEEEEQSESSKYKNLTPEALGTALLEADEFTISATIQGGGSTENITYTQIFSKYGDLMKSVIKLTSEGYTSDHEGYADIKNDLVYTQEDGVWTTQTEKTDLNDMLEGILYSNWFLEQDNYPEFDSKADRLDIDPGCIREIMNLDESVPVEGYFSRKGSEYTIFFCATPEGGNAQSYTATVTFKADKITLPEVESAGNKGEAVPDVKD